jgi:16S rRNA (uracil1498-N3)-methyltransferase
LRKHRVFVSQLHAGEFVLDGAAFHHLVHVLRAREETPVVLVDSAAGKRAHAHISEVRDNDATLFVGDLEDALGATPLWLLQALAKADKCDAIVRDATELGATLIQFVETERTVVRIDGERAKQRASRWATIAEQAARQSGRDEVAQICGPTPWLAAVLGVPETFARIVLWERADEPLLLALESAIRDETGIAFAVGPEGGLTLDEVAAARDAGWRICSLGSSILRTETVAAAVFGAVRVLAGS